MTETFTNKLNLCSKCGQNISSIFALSGNWAIGRNRLQNYFFRLSGNWAIRTNWIMSNVNVN